MNATNTPDETMTALAGPEEFGSYLRRARKRQGMTQAELAALAGVGVRFISDLERGKASAHLGLALRVTRLLGVELIAIERSALPAIRLAVRERKPGDER